MNCNRLKKISLSYQQEFVSIRTEFRKYRKNLSEFHQQWCFFFLNLKKNWYEKKIPFLGISENVKF